jgi:hypothetical protein
MQGPLAEATGSTLPRPLTQTAPQKGLAAASKSHALAPLALTGFAVAEASQPGDLGAGAALVGKTILYSG